MSLTFKNVSSTQIYIKSKRVQLKFTDWTKQILFSKRPKLKSWVLQKRLLFIDLLHKWILELAIKEPCIVGEKCIKIPGLLVK